MLVLVFSLLLAFVLGFSAHRTGICTVSAVAEVITSKTAMTFLSFLKVIAWVALVGCVAGALLPELMRPYSAPILSLSVILSVLAGGLIFGVGAGINGGCSFSTISKIAQGDLHVALTLPAFVLGALSCTSLSVGQSLIVDEPRYAVAFSDVPMIFLIVLSVWGVYELVRTLWRVVSSGALDALVSTRYRLSSGAAVIGVSSGFLYLAHGRWAYSSKIMDYFGGLDAASSVSGPASVYLILALFTGAAASAVSNRELKWSFARDKWHRNLIGGFLMGFGAMMVPGGNGKLILHDLPHLSAHAVVAYLAMVAGIALVLLLQKRLYGQIDVVSCVGDECKVTKA
jgi:uncharacterized membrane protein YedE/YeeE